jgi:hypothetical protein
VEGWQKDLIWSTAVPFEMDGAAKRKSSAAIALRVREIT